jgi:hypothetical protein
VSTENVRRETQAVGEWISVRYRGAEADYVVVVDPGIAAGSSVIEGFCARLAADAADVWRIDTPPNNGRGLFDSVEAAIALGTDAGQITELPVFLLGFGTGAAVAYHALHTSNVFWGAVLVDDLSAAFTRSDPAHPRHNGSGDLWVYHVLYYAAQLELCGARVGHAAEPMLCVIAEHDRTLACKKAKAIISATASRPEMYLYPGDLNDLITSDAGSNMVREWCLRQLSNHFNPKWNGG